MTVFPHSPAQVVRASSLALVAVAASAPGPGEAAERAVGILPVRGGAPAEVRRAAEAALKEALEGLEGLRPVAFAGLGAVFGPRAQAAIEACGDDDGCLAREATGLIAVDRLVVTELDRSAEAPRLDLRLRLIDPQQPQIPRARVTREATVESLRATVAAAVSELFPDAAARSLGEVVLSGVREGARVVVDGEPIAELGRSLVSSEPQTNLRLPPGAHAVEVRYPGHFPFRANVEVVVGAPVTLEVDLRKNRSVGPWILAGSGALVLGVGGLVGLSAQRTADDWSGACSPACPPGFTRERFEDDSAAVDTQRTVANTMLITGGVAILGAAIWYLLDPGTDPEPRAEAP